MIKVIQWASGTLGKEAMRQIIDRPDTELVGLYTYSPGKAGGDAGDICGRPETGVLATNDRDAILALDADVVLHMPSLEPTTDNSDRDVITLLRSGKNVISTRGYIYPRWRGADYEAKFIEAGHAGNATLFGTGQSPGFAFDRFNAFMTSTCIDVRKIQCIEYYDLTSRPKRTIFDVCGLGSPQGTLTTDSMIIKILDNMYEEQAHYLAYCFGTTVEGFSTELDFDIAPADFDVGVGIIPKNSVQGVVMQWTTNFAGGLTMNQRGYWHVKANPDWDTRDVWRVEITGTPNVIGEYFINDHMSPDRSFHPGSLSIIAPGLNAIEDVIAAPAGIFLPLHPGVWKSKVWRAGRG